jgi:glycosyltransferase involved in cell wall biosynthesis
MAERLRIAQLAPVAAAVRPDSARSIEQLISLLTEELVRRGHEVTLFATGDSQTSATLCALYERGYSADNNLCHWEFHEALHAAAAFEGAQAFDVIHSHAYHYALPFTRLVRTPILHSYHILPNADIVPAFARLGAHVAALSDYQRQIFRGLNDVTVVYHGIDTNAFPFNPERGAYLFFLGAMTPGKGPVAAIELARSMGMHLVLAGPGDEDRDYFRAEVEPRIDGRTVAYVGPVGVKERNRLLAGAAALVYPLAAPEPFGLVTIEAMACGTPVAALDLGAVPEIVTNGVTGYHAPDAEILGRRLPAVLALDRRRVRREAVRRFDYRRMVDDYLAVYRRIVERSGEPEVGGGSFLIR